MALLFEDQLPMVIAIGVAAVIVALIGWRRASGRWLVAAMLVGLLAVAVWGVGEAVVTDREQVLRQTRKLVDVVQPVQAAPFGELLADEVELVSAGSMVRWTRDQVVELATAVQRRGDQPTHHSYEHGAEVDEIQARSWMGITTVTGDGLRAQSHWTLFWRQDADGQWRIHRIRCDQFYDQALTQPFWRMGW